MTNFSFIQLADPQFGMFASVSRKTDDEIAAFAKRGLMIRKTKPIEGFAPETGLFTRAIEHANSLKPAFVVVCGDITNEAGDKEQITEAKRIAALLDESIALHWVPGNHDVAFDHNNPSQECVELYRENFGPDYYSFSYGAVKFIVINSTVLTTPETMEQEAKAQIAFVETEADNAVNQNSSRIILFSHHPLFVESPDESNNPWSIEKKYRMPLLRIAEKHGIEANFAGHWHHNNIASANGIETVASGPVGYPLGDDPSGYRVVNVTSNGITHTYHTLETDS